MGEDDLNIPGLDEDKDYAADALGKEEQHEADDDCGDACKI